jgi:hypothetical protein
MEDSGQKYDKILQELTEKSVTKQNVYNTALAVFNEIKEVLTEVQDHFNEKLSDIDKRVMFSFEDNGIFDAKLKFSGDVLLFHMHSNIFEFNREHAIWKISYIQDNPYASYCAIINIYNFLADSFKYNRYEDLGYLIARIFVNKDRHYFVEGKRQLGFLYNDFGKSTIDKKALKEIIETAISYALEFDLLVPPYDHVKIASVAQMTQKLELARMRTGKRLGFRFNSDDID